MDKDNKDNKHNKHNKDNKHNKHNKEILIYKPSHISAETLTGFILLKYSNNVADEVLKRLDLTKEETDDIRQQFKEKIPQIVLNKTYKNLRTYLIKNESSKKENNSDKSK